MNISVIVCTKDRPQQLLKCLEALTRQRRPAEIIVVDGSKTSPARDIIGTFRQESYKRIRYVQTAGGLSEARNQGIKRARADIIAFTDDDCIPDSGWTDTIIRAFQAKKNIDILVGRVAPFEPEKHKGFTAISLHAFSRRVNMTKSSPRIVGIGTGNNMAMRRSIFSSFGGFATWLGRGSSACATEDEEFFYRYLKAGATVLQEPKALVYHNHWMTRHERDLTLARYSCGYFAMLSYHMLGGDRHAGNLLSLSLHDLLREWRKSLGFGSSRAKRKQYGKRLIFGLWGIAIGLWQQLVWRLRRIGFKNFRYQAEFGFP